MPILNIEIVGAVAQELRSDLAPRLADLAGEALGSRPQGTWIKLHFIPREHYAENARGPGQGVLPVIVSLLQADVPEGEALAEQIRLLTQAIATGVGRSAEHIHIIVEPPARGRIAFGGSLN